MLRGNFTKITQRVQLKVSIDSVSEGNLDQYYLLSVCQLLLNSVKQ